MRNPEKIRVLLVDDHLLVRQGLRRVLEADPRIAVVGEVGDGESAIEAAFRLRPTVVVIDIGLPGINGIEATSRILRRMGDVAVLMVSMHARRALCAPEPESRRHGLRPEGLRGARPRARRA